MCVSVGVCICAKDSIRMSEKNISLFFSVCHSGCLFVSFSKSSFDVFKFIAVKCTSNETHLPFYPVCLRSTKDTDFRNVKTFQLKILFHPSFALILILNWITCNETFHMHSSECIEKYFQKGTYHSTCFFFSFFFFFLSSFRLSLWFLWNREIA